MKFFSINTGLPTQVQAKTIVNGCFWVGVVVGTGIFLLRKLCLGARAIPWAKYISLSRRLVIECVLLRCFVIAPGLSLISPTFREPNLDKVLESEALKIIIIFFLTFFIKTEIYIFVLQLVMIGYYLLFSIPFSLMIFSHNLWKNKSEFTNKNSWWFLLFISFIYLIDRNNQKKHKWMNFALNYPISFAEMWLLKRLKGKIT